MKNKMSDRENNKHREISKKSKLKKQQAHRGQHLDLRQRGRRGRRGRQAQETRLKDNGPTRGRTETYIHTGKGGAIEHRWNTWGLVKTITKTGSEERKPTRTRAYKIKHGAEKRKLKGHIIKSVYCLFLNLLELATWATGFYLVLFY